jgi:CheY-like chemotaxis protein
MYASKLTSQALLLVRRILFAFCVLDRPTVEEVRQRMNKPEQLLPSRANQTVILLVEDETLIRNTARMVLEREGYSILTAADGEEALLLSRSFPGKIHLLLSDVTMPRMDGLQLREKLLEERPATKALLMSAQVEKPLKQGFLRKPFTLDVLRKRVREMLTPWRKARSKGTACGR